MSNLPNPQNQPQRDDEITLKDILRTLGQLLGYWPVLAVSAIAGLAIAFIINRYTPNTYRISSTVAVEELKIPSLRMEH